jgi:hypothetical protein
VLSRAYDTTWEDGDRVGIYMIAANAGNLDGAKASNALYTINTDNTPAGLGPVGKPIYYPLNDDEVKFVAYYPYKDSDEIPGGLYPVNVYSQSSIEDLEAIDLMIGEGKKQPYKLSEGRVVSLQFTHKLSKLLITAKPATSTVIDMSDASLTIRGMPTTANCNLSTGVFIDWDDIDNIVALRKNPGDTETAVWEALIIPHTAGNSTFRILTSGGTYIYPPDGVFDPGQVYKYIFELE